MGLRLTEEEYRELKQRLKPPAKPGSVTLGAAELGAAAKAMAGAEEAKRSKYGNQRVELDGMKFDSKREASAYIALMMRVKAGELKCVLRQVPFDLPGGIRYIADFVTIRPDMTIEAVIDAKSEATKKNRVYINKKKQMKACWGIEIEEV